MFVDQRPKVKIMWDILKNLHWNLQWKPSMLANYLQYLYVDLYVLQDSWDSVLDIINYNGDHQDEMIPYVGPGNFNDMDMVRKFISVRNMNK